ncbi:MAG: FAD-dependent oxidoreductase [Ignavibacteria bacterium]
MLLELISSIDEVRTSKFVGENKNLTMMKFDTIIYSANISGVVASLILKYKGQKVLLLNRYGFFGGTITESLNLLQKKVELDSDTYTHKILNRVAEFNEGILFKDDKYILFNPEIVKYILQKLCEENEIELLFHITPYQIDFSDETIKVTVIGKEGEINLSTSRLIDLSSEFTFAPLIDKTSRKFLNAKVNFISTPVNEAVLVEGARKIKLKDERWWISVDLNPQNIFEVEENANQTLDKIDELLRQNKSRIQIVPAQSHLIFSFQKSNKFDQRISFITDFVEKFESTDEILIAKRIEEHFSNEANI